MRDNLRFVLYCEAAGVHHSGVIYSFTITRNAGQTISLIDSELNLHILTVTYQLLRHFHLNLNQ